MFVFDGGKPHAFRCFEGTTRQVVYFRPERLPMSHCEETAELLQVLSQRGFMTFDVTASVSRER